MTQLIVADDDAWMSTFGVVPTPEQVSGDEFVSEVRIAAGGSGELHLSWDAVHRSVRLRTQGESVSMDLYREEATLLTVINGDIVVEYGLPGFQGRTRVRFTTGLSIKDEVLR